MSVSIALLAAALAASTAQGNNNSNLNFCEHSFVPGFSKIYSSENANFDWYDQLDFTKKDLESNDNFITYRFLSDYNQFFETRHNQYAFVDHLKSLPKDSVWMDMGAGNANALLDGAFRMDLSNIGQFIAVSYSAPRDFKKDQAIERHKGRFKYLETGFIEEHLKPDHQLSDTMAPYKNSVDLLTDVWGPLSYTHEVEKLFHVYFSLLKKQGKLMIVFSQLKLFENSEHLGDKIYFNGEKKPATIKESIERLLSMFSGTEYSIEMVNESRDTNMLRQTFALVLTKTADEVKIPSIETVRFYTGRPVRRHLMIKNKL